MKTLQEIFDQVATHLMTQQERALDAHYSCRYRTETGLKCAVGCLIENAHYTSLFENAAAVAITVQSTRGQLLKDALHKSGIDVHNLSTVNMLRKLQAIHDDFPIRDWRTLLESVATEYNLNYTTLEQAATPQ